MGDAAPAGRVRDPERSREAILDAAERLFAERGYEATSLEEIGRLAGVSRGTPGYFFRSKERLYQAVLERILAVELAFVLAAREEASAAGGDSTGMLVAVIGALVDFLAAHPNFVRLLEREALAGGRHLRDTAAHATALREGLALLSPPPGTEGAPGDDPAALLLALLALCWFPFAHADTFVRPLGLDPASPAFLARWKRQIAGLVLGDARAR